MSVEGKVAIVTGGGRGLGRAMALGLARAGASVVVTAAREVAEVDAVVAADEKEGSAGKIHGIVADVTRPEDCDRVVNDALSEFGRLDILVNNAGRGMRYVNERFLEEAAPFWKTDPETWRMIIDTNVNGPFYMARAVVPHLLERGWGRIVNITLNAATMRRPGFSPYGPSKAALESETIIWAGECGGTGVTVNCLSPGGATLTGMIPEGVSDAIRKDLLDPDVMVPPLLWLVSEAADGATGGRYIAIEWDTSLPPHVAAEKARAPAGWPVSGT